MGKLRDIIKDKIVSTLLGVVFFAFFSYGVLTLSQTLLLSSIAVYLGGKIADAVFAEPGYCPAETLVGVPPEVRFYYE